jgi:hypothetical protein
MTPAARRCSVEGCSNAAAYEVTVYDVGAPEGRTLTPHPTRPYVCRQHAGAGEEDVPGPHGREGTGVVLHRPLAQALEKRLVSP